MATSYLKEPFGLQKWLVLLSATFCAVAMGRNIWAWFGPPSWKPRITCFEPVFDFGYREPGESVEHQFTLRNTGTEDLVISNVSADCECLAAQLNAERIPPAHQLELPARVLVKERPDGIFRQRLVVATNDPATPNLSLTIVGHVRLSERADAGNSPVER